MTSSGAMWLAVFSTVASAVFSALYVCLTDLRRGVLEEIAVRNSTRPNSKAASDRVDRILDDVRGHARAMALPRLLFSVMVIVCVLWWIEQVDQTTQLSFTNGLLAALFTGVVLWVCTVIIPLGIASHAAERFVYAFSGPIRVVYVIESPLRPMARFLDEVVRRLAGADDDDDASQLETELMSVIDEGRREGQIDETEEEMIEAVVQLRAKTVVQIMTPRTEIEALPYSDDLGAVTGIIRKIGHSRIPVYKDNLDNIVGIFYVKDLMKWLAGSGARAGSNKPFELKSILRPALFVPESKTVRELLKELLEKKLHIAMVADEYGGTSGLVTVEDIVEQVFGEIYDEYEPDEEETDPVAVDVTSRIADVDARAYIDEVNDALSPLNVSLPPSDEYDTVGGYVITTLGRIPEKGESFRDSTGNGRVMVHVVDATPTRVLRVRLEVGDTQEGSAGEDPRVEIKTSEGADARAIAGD